MMELSVGPQRNIDFGVNFTKVDDKPYPIEVPLCEHLRDAKNVLPLRFKFGDETGQSIGPKGAVIACAYRIRVGIPVEMEVLNTRHPREIFPLSGRIVQVIQKRKRRFKPRVRHPRGDRYYLLGVRFTKFSKEGREGLRQLLEERAEDL